MGNLNVNDWSVTANANDVIDSGIVAAEGEPPGAVNDAMRGIMASLARWLKDNNGTLSAGGASNAYTLSSPNVAYTALNAGLVVSFKAAFTNTGAATLNLGSLGPKKLLSLTAPGSGDLAANQIRNNGHYVVHYDAAADSGNGAWILLNPSPDPGFGMTGEVRIWSTATAPAGWLLCDGSVVSQATYAALFAVVGATYNTGGEGAGNFRLPDLRGRCAVGLDPGGAAGRISLAGGGYDSSTLGANGGTQSRTIGVANLPSHTHTFSATTAATNTDHTHTYSGTTGSSATGIGVVSHTTGITLTASGTGIAVNAAATGATVNSAATGISLVAAATGVTLGTESAGHTHVTQLLRGTVAAGGGSATDILTPFSGTAINFASGGESASHSHAVSDPTHGHTVSDPQHAHGVTDPTHAHGVSDPTHNHAVNDGGHVHAITDPTHAHAYSGTTAAMSANASHTHAVSGTSDATGGGTALLTLNPGLVLAYIIKT